MTVSSTIKVPIYNTSIFLSLGQEDEVFSKELKRKLPNIYSNDLESIEILEGLYKDEGGTAQFNNGCVVIRVKEKEVTALWHSVLAHEIFHATEFILRNVGMKLNSGSHEAYAYLISYITEKVYNLILKEHGKDRRK